MNWDVYYRERDMLGSADSGAAPSLSQLYLLNASLRILGAVGERDVLGKVLSEVYPMDEQGIEQLRAFVKAPAERLLLLPVGGEPFLFVGSLFATTGVLVACRPLPEEAALLREPAKFLGEISMLQIGGGFSGAYREAKRFEVQAVQALCRQIMAALGEDPIAPQGTLWYGAFSRRLSALCRLCHCRATFDFCNWYPQPTSMPEWQCFAALLLCAMLDRRECDEEREVQVALKGEDRAPILQLVYPCAQSDKHSLVFSPIAETLQARGMDFGVFEEDEAPYRMLLYAVLQRPALERQGTKEVHPLAVRDTYRPTRARVFDIPQEVSDHRELRWDE